MTIQRKLLTTEQKSDICKKYYKEGTGCDTCPLGVWILGEHFCIYNLNQVENAIKDYLNEEIEIDYYEDFVSKTTD